VICFSLCFRVVCIQMCCAVTWTIRSFIFLSNNHCNKYHATIPDRSAQWNYMWLWDCIATYIKYNFSSLDPL
jgi:hypothetical protein